MHASLSKFHLQAVGSPARLAMLLLAGGGLRLGSRVPGERQQTPKRPPPACTSRLFHHPQMQLCTEMEHCVLGRSDRWMRIEHSLVKLLMGFRVLKHLQ